MNNKKNTYIVGGIVILAIIIWVIYAFSNQGTTMNSNSQQTANQNGSNNPTPTPTASRTDSGKLSYGEAINAYPYRIQFTQCHGNPGALAVKKNSIVMLDNRDAKVHTFKADSQTIKIAAQDYALLYTVNISNINITCDGGGAAILNVQK